MNTDKRTKGTWFIDKGMSAEETMLRVECKDEMGIELFDVCSFAPDETDNTEANAAFICKAVNNHDDLVKALEGFLKVINRSDAALYHYGPAIYDAELLIKKLKP